MEPIKYEPERLLKEGSVVIIKTDPTETLRKITRSMPDIPHRYIISGWLKACKKDDLIVVKGESR